MKMLIIKWPNENILEIQVKQRLCEYKYKHSPPEDGELTPEFLAFRDKLRSIHGLERVDIGRHSITLERYDIFDWDELTPQVVEEIQAHTGFTYDDIVTDDRSQPSRASSPPDWDEAA